MSGKRSLTRAELDLWQHATADVRPLANLPEYETPPPEHSRAKPVKAQASPGVNGVKSAPPSKQARPAPPAPKALDPTRPVDIDRRLWERLKRGQIVIERKLDLHGRTQTEAHTALNRFLTMAAATGLRCVLVVTGKGGADGRGVLRQMVPRWLAETNNSPIVLTYAPAQPRHGGDGALYVLLRRRRDSDRR